MSQLTVVQILPALNSGGVERGTLEVARALVAAGHRSIVISHGGRMVAQLESEGSRHIAMPVHRKSLGSLWQVRPLRQLLVDLQPDILHARSRVPAWIAWLAWRKLPATARPHFLTTVHGLNSVGPYSAIMVCGERVIAVSETVRDYILKNYPQCPPEKIELIYRGIDPLEFPYDYQPSPDWMAKWQQDFPQLAGKIVLTLPGRITRLKGHESLIELVAALRKQCLPVHGLIAGGAEAKKKGYLTEVKSRIKARGLENDISFTGHRNDLKEVLAVSDIVYSLSNKAETFGRTTLEALSLGVPVLGWDQGGVSEILQRRFPQGAVPFGNNEMLLARTLELIKNPVKPPQQDSFRLETMLSQTLALYEKVAAKNT
jgi:glycosyltransferase involved in cell wall biosynthesis